MPPIRPSCVAVPHRVFRQGFRRASPACAPPLEVHKPQHRVWPSRPEPAATLEPPDSTRSAARGCSGLAGRSGPARRGQGSGRERATERAPRAWRTRCQARGREGTPRPSRVPRHRHLTQKAQRRRVPSAHLRLGSSPSVSHPRQPLPRRLMAS